MEVRSTENLMMVRQHPVFWLLNDVNDRYVLFGVWWRGGIALQFDIFWVGNGFSLLIT
jgi:hypothetical protein